MLNVVITGANGQLGQSLQACESLWQHARVTYLSRQILDLTDTNAIACYFDQHPADIIINAAAYTAVDQAETDTKAADAINHLAVAALAQAAQKHQSVLIHISTDYVFNGINHKPWIESDAIAPNSVYGITKAQGEQAFINSQAKGLIIRTSWVYSEYGNNFVKTMCRLGAEREQLNVIFDQIGSPTYARDLAEVIIAIAQSDKVTSLQGDIFHYSNEGVASWYDFAKAIMEQAKYTCSVLPIESKDYPTPATRPHYSLLNKAKIKQTFGLVIPHWRDSLAKLSLKFD